MCDHSYMCVDETTFPPGKVKAIVDSVFAFDEVLDGYERVMTSRACGKVVVKVDSSIE